MNRQDLEKYINQIIVRVKNSEQVEENKVELKSQWYNFAETENKRQNESEFLKDLVAIANTVGITGYLIIGINDTNGEIKDSPFLNCGLKDIADLQKLIVKSVDRPVDFDYLEINVTEDSKSSIIGIFIIPPSLEKPHVIRYYLSKKEKEIINFIPVKKGTSINPANRSDIELMYYDRKNIEPDYILEIKTYEPKLVINSTTTELNIDFQLCFQNSGRKPIIIVEIFLNISGITVKGFPDSIALSLSNYELNMSTRSEKYHINLKFLVIPQNSVQTVYCNFKTRIAANLRNDLTSFLRSKKDYNLSIEIRDINNKKYFSDVNDFK